MLNNAEPRIACGQDPIRELFGLHHPTRLIMNISPNLRANIDRCLQSMFELCSRFLTCDFNEAKKTIDRCYTAATKINRQMQPHASFFFSPLEQGSYLSLKALMKSASNLDRAGRGPPTFDRFLIGWEALKVGLPRPLENSHQSLPRLRSFYSGLH